MGAEANHRGPNSQVHLAPCGELEPTDVAALRAAVIEVEQWRLASSVRTQNRNVGVAPPTVAVVDRYQRQRLLTAPSVRPRPWGQNGSSTMRVSVCRRRVRFDGRVRIPSPREYVPEAEARIKALPMSESWKLIDHPWCPPDQPVVSSNDCIRERGWLVPGLKIEPGI